MASSKGPGETGSTKLMARRGFLLALTASATLPFVLPREVRGQAPSRSLIPRSRPEGLAAATPRAAAAAAPRTAAVQSVEALLARANLGGVSGFVAIDARTGREIESHEADTLLPPASVAKAPTALYALEGLGAGYRFGTRVLSTGGAVENGVLRGDLILQGGGDPTFQTDDLIALARQLSQRGLRRITGRFIVDESALPLIERIDGAQAEQAGYNPAISGMNLNFNRVHFAWSTRQGRIVLAMDARGRSEVPAVSVIGISGADRGEPVYTHRIRDGRESWTVARPALNREGSRWLPVRLPGLYAGDVLRVLMAARGCELPAPQVARGAASGSTVLAEQHSAPLTSVLTDMLRFSTNITAEICGLSASRRAEGSIAGLAASGTRMTRWLADQHGVRGARFVDHSGLGGESRISARQMAQFMRSARGSALPGMLRAHVMRDENGREIANHPVSVNAKTGTLSFASGLAGYARVGSGANSGREIIFAIFSADLPRRAAIRENQRDNPQGADVWARRARVLQQGLIERWAGLPG